MRSGLEILRKCRADLYKLYPYLDGAYAGIVMREAGNGETGTIAADGNIFFYNEDWLVSMWQTGEHAVHRMFLHMLLHCMYRHVIVPAGDRTLYDRACDIAVELIIEEECLRNYKAGQLMGLPVNAARRDFFRQIQKRTGQKTPSAEKIADLLREDSELLNKISSISLTDGNELDDHHLWYIRSSEENAALERKWFLIDRHTQAGTGGHGGLGNGGSMGMRAGGDREKVGRPDKSRTDYRSFLREFTVPGEAMELDPEEFDYIYYTLGLEHFGDRPLIEPLEYREGHRLRQLAIAIDTSGSCSAETVRRFLAETYAILGESENFFSRMEVLVVQCDAFVQEAVMIRSREEWYRYVDDLVIKGRGGTDFRPVFDYIDRLQRSGRMTELKALIYFTDGDGVYPTMKPESRSGYETAFVSLDRNKQPGFMPRWVRRVILNEYF